MNEALLKEIKQQIAENPEQFNIQACERTLKDLCDSHELLFGLMSRADAARAACTRKNGE